MKIYEQIILLILINLYIMLLLYMYIGLTLAHRLNIEFIETSAKNEVNVN